ncbi:MAG: hypothetical protein ACFE85_10720 [Candidatus Hodarchaeota archaeon]
MSSGIIQKEEIDIIDLQMENEKSILEIVSDISIPFSEILRKENSYYIYSGIERMQFNERHPIFKAILKLEFEEAVLDYLNKRQV